MDILTVSLPERRSRSEMPKFAPMRMLDIELSEPLPVFFAWDEATKQHYLRALCLVRLHSRPLGLVELFFTEDKLLPEDYVGPIWEVLGSYINKHLREDGLAPLTALDTTGVPAIGTPRCIEERERFLEHAPFVSVIVPTHNRPDLVRRCIDSLLELHYPNYEIIVVDNAPKDNATAELVERFYSNKPVPVRYVLEKRPGVARARNRGMYAARGSVLAYIDDDVLIDRYLLAEQVRAFDVVENVACVTGQILPMELETPPQFWVEEYGGYSKGFVRQIFDLKKFRPANLPLYPYTAGRFGAGANMAFRADYLRSVGGFDVLLEYGSDIESFFRVVSRGYRLVYEPTALVRHPHYREYHKLKRQLYNYGTGLTAFLTRTVLERPTRLLDLIVKIPYGFYFVLADNSPKNQKKQPDYPAELTRSELKGMLRGPLIYLRRRLTANKDKTYLEENVCPAYMDQN
jgi:glycosyltransferase involved in cell wall biosynthesis